MKTKTNKMKNIVFSKLLKYDIYYKVGSVHLQNKRFRRVCMNQEWGSRKKFLQRLKKKKASTP
jgi:hypothetical protein